MDFDIHLSAEAVRDSTISDLSDCGFVQDHFRNNRNSKPPHFHATYRGTQAYDHAWECGVVLLKNDPSFRGCLEFESFTDECRFNLDTLDKVSSGGILPARPFEFETCKPGEHKACDLHINVDLGQTTKGALDELEKFNFISFERTVQGIDRRIYSLTFDDEDSGERVLGRLVMMFARIPGLFGKMKLEHVERFFVYPKDAEQLPIVRKKFAREWLKQ